MKIIKNKTFLITGGNGFLGSCLVKKLNYEGKNRIIIPRSNEYDLSIESDVKKIFKKYKKIDYVIHLASVHGGLYFNIKNSGYIYYKNILMNTYLMNYSMLNNVSKFISAGTVDCYPKKKKVPWSEDDLWSGYPEETSAAYAFSKKMLLVQGYAYRQQYSFNAVHLLFMNLYGPNDQFDSKKSHVIPAIIKKIYIATKNKKKIINLYGSGNQKREFLYIDDAAQAIILALKKYNSTYPLNIGTGKNHSIKQVANKIVKIMNSKIKIKWIKKTESGIKNKLFHVNKAKKKIGFSAKIKLEDGLKKTINWYKKEKM